MCISDSFKSDEINKNKKTLIEGQNRIPDFMGFLGELKKGARLAENPKGYVIGAITVSYTHLIEGLTSKRRQLFFTFGKSM